MLVLSMNSKRQRRPNVRLGEIGDVSAAFSFSGNHKNKEDIEEGGLKHELENPSKTYFQPTCGFSTKKRSEFGVSDPGVSPRVSIEKHNCENLNPNSAQPGAEFASSDKSVSKPRLDFGNVTRKGRLMKRRGRIAKGSGVGYSVWNSRISPEVSNENGNGYGGNEFVEPISNNSYYSYAHEGFKDSSATSKEPCENNWIQPIPEVQLLGDPNAFLMENVFKVSVGLSSDDDGHCFVDKARISRTVVDSVKGWLEKLGFGKYVGVFEMHEVDEEVLPFLTFEDLKEMGVDAVGPRRKMFAAIQVLKQGVSV